VSTEDPLRQGAAPTLAAALQAQRARTLALFGALRRELGEACEVPMLEVINPPRWELGHHAWFEEFWLARNSERWRGCAARLEAPRGASLLPRSDALYDSSAVAHARRWQLDLPDARRTLDYAARVRERTCVLLGDARSGDDALYFFRLVLAHEAMHHEAGAMIAQTLGLAVADALPVAAPAPLREAGQLDVAAARLLLGRDEGGFAFDNELGEHTVDVAAFAIDRTPRAWRDVLAFIEDGGYDEPRLWSDEGWAWRRRALPAAAPRGLLRDGDGAWQREVFGRRRALDADEPALHLSAHEAQAWCRWAARRLPTEHEWSLAAQDARFEWGSVWEWTASPFVPFPGFRPHPYRDYSLPWFDGRPVLKGGSFTSAPFMKHARYRNYFGAGRNDVFAGFRSCASA
jgi:iron(II)-dependent oxidoreductase